MSYPKKGDSVGYIRREGNELHLLNSTVAYVYGEPGTYAAECIDLVTRFDQRIDKVVYYGWLLGANQGWVFSDDDVVAHIDEPVKKYALGKSRLSDG